MAFSRRTFMKNGFGLASASWVAASLPLSAAEAAVRVLAGAGQRASSAGFKVVENGQARAVLVTPDAASAVVAYAATELQSHIERATGARLAIVSERDAEASALKNRIYLGACRAGEKAGIKVDDLPPNGFHQKIAADAMFLFGKDGDKGAPPLDDAVSMGTLFAVYDWLERQIGARWLWPGDFGTVVTKTQNLSSGAIFDGIVVPALIHSRARIDGWSNMNPDKDKYIYETSVWMRRQRFARGVSFQYGHAYTKYWERFGSTHPEYFALRPDGVRAPFDPKRPELVQMCVSNPGLHRQIIDDWLIQRKEKPSLAWINGIENDKTANDPACTCDVCRSWDAKQSATDKKNLWLNGAETAKSALSPPQVSLSDRYARFWLALQEEGKKHDPAATVIGYAYADYTEPPLEAKMNQNIIVGIVPPYIFPIDEKMKVEARALWDGWNETGARLYLRPNYFLAGYDMPYIFAEQFGEEFQYDAQHGMIATDFDSLLGMWGVQGPNFYVMARLNVQPQRKVSEVLDEYYSGFGAAARPVREYFNFWQTVTQKCDNAFWTKSAGGWAAVSKSGDEVYTAATFQKGTQLLSKAKAAAASDAGAMRRIEFLGAWLEHAELSMKTLAAFHAQQKNPTDEKLQTDFAQAKAALDDYRKAHRDDIENVGVLRQLEVWSGWRPKSELGT